MNNQIDSTRYDRILKALMIEYGCSKKEALNRLKSLTIKVEAGPSIEESLPLQAALLTAVNTAKRAFAGGLIIDIPQGISLKLPLDGYLTMDEAIENIAKANIVNASEAGSPAFTLLFGKSSNSYSELEVVCNGWQGGVVAKNENISLESINSSLPLGGIYAGGLGVACAFNVAAHLDIKAADKSRGLSLWNFSSSDSWHLPENNGQKVKVLPPNLWLLGLGHIGQAHAWTISQLPYSNKKPKIYLMDFDSIEDSNLGSGLVSFDDHIGETKTSVVSYWLKSNQFETRIIDRPFTSNTRIEPKEPFNEPLLALSGFDNTVPRMALSEAGFDVVIDSGIGGELHSFDSIAIRIFPNQFRTPEETWTVNGNGIERHDYDCDDFGELMKYEMEDKAISTSFVGAITSSIAFAELIKALHGEASNYSITYKIRPNRVKYLTDESVSAPFRRHYIEV